MPLRFAIFGLTISSSWGNGHATLWRALVRARHHRGHHVTFCTLHGYRSAIQLLSSKPPEEDEVTGPALGCPAPARRVDSILQPQAA